MHPQNKTAPEVNRRDPEKGGSANSNGTSYHSSSLVAKAELAKLISGDKRLRHSTVRVATAMLFKFHSTRKDLCFPSHDAIADWVGLDRRRVIEAIRQLEHFGYLIVERGTGRSNRYRFNFDVTLAPLVEAGSGDANDTSGVTPATQGSDASITSEVTLPTPYPVALPSGIDPVTLPSGRRTQMKKGMSSKNSASDEEYRATGASPRHKPTKRKTALPQNWRPSDAGIDFAFHHGMTGDRLDDEIAHFAAHHRRRGTLSSDWEADWQVWALNDKQFRPKANGQGRGRRSSYADILPEEDAG